MGRFWIRLSIVGVLVGGTLGLGPTTAGANGEDPVHADFDGDGRDDLAITAPFDEVGSKQDAGSVTVVYGSTTGLDRATGQLWTQDSPGIDGVAEFGDRLGFDVAAGDFDRDSFADLAIGAPFEGKGTAFESGAVHVLRGSADGLTATGNQVWTQDSPGIQDQSEAQDLFGVALAVGDFDGDGFADLAVSVREEDLGGDAFEDAGLVQILYGGPSGLSAARTRSFTQNSPGIPDEKEPTDMFGAAVAAGDLDGDGRDDLAIGVQGEDLGVPQTGVGDAGAVQVLYGSDTGLLATRNQLWTQDTPGVRDQAEGADLFGSDLIMGDFNGDGVDDLAAAAFAEDVGAGLDAGSVNVLYGGEGGLTAAGDQFVTQATPGVPERPEGGDFFGSPLAAGDLDGDGRDELVAGVSNESVGVQAQAGAVYVMSGSPQGLVPGGGLLLTQDSEGVPERAESQDHFGGGIAVGRFGRGPLGDLAIGAFGETLAGQDRAGAVVALYGGQQGVGAGGAQLLVPGRSGMPGTADGGDFFGFRLGPRSG